MAGTRGADRMKSCESRLSSTVALIATPGCAPSTGECRRSSSPGAENPKNTYLSFRSPGSTVGASPSRMRSSLWMIAAALNGR